MVFKVVFIVVLLMFRGFGFGVVFGIGLIFWFGLILIGLGCGVVLNILVGLGLIVFG